MRFVYLDLIDIYKKSILIFNYIWQQNKFYMFGFYKKIKISNEKN